MALRLAGEEFSVVQGLDAQGYVRDVLANDANPGLKVDQKGTGAVLELQDGGVTRLLMKDERLTLSSSDMEFDEITDPAAPAANKARLYAKDNGAGKTQLVVRFPTGAVQVLATEP